MRIMLTGGTGMLAGALVRAAARVGSSHEIVAVTRRDADLTDAAATRALLERVAPDMVVHTAARVGGIAANIAQPAEFLMDNLRIDTNVLGGSRDAGITRALYFGSSCMYPRDYRQPLVEGDVLAAPLEPTNEGYAISKIAAARYCEYVSREYGLAYRVVIPSNLYGPGDDYTPGHSHLVAAALLKAHDARETGADSIDVWGDGTARREFTYTDDLADFVMTNIDRLEEWPVLMNVGQGVDHSVTEYYEAALEVVGHAARLDYDRSKPVGMMQKLMDSTVAAGYGWMPRTTLLEGMRVAYARYVDDHDKRESTR
ncbi:NAD-dependent epimerase/dehydratase family protein [Pseudolysinimonas sp.]|jgi:GDP-L-fucose synthase|uniref:NAD-dependent epimerase/dehydratase family protein n=1 Tax=Pseudolysinimonas sp. TaxID=2680009 RepID=UPI003782F7C1